MIRHAAKLVLVIVVGQMTQYSILTATRAAQPARSISTSSTSTLRFVGQDSGSSKLSAQKSRLTIRTTVDGEGAIPSFTLHLSSSGRASVMIKVESTPYGLTSAEFPLDDRRVSVWGLPLGYQVKSLTHGGVDLTKSPLKITSNQSAEIRIELSTKSEVPLRNVRGRLSGISPNARVRLILNAVASDAIFPARVNEDGVFSFFGVPEGVYAPSIEGAVTPLGLAPQVIVVRGGNTASLNLVASPREAAGLSPAPTAIQKATNEPGSSRSRNEEEATLALRSLNGSLSVFRDINNGRYGDLESLVAAGITGKNYLGVNYGYRLFLIPYANGYSAVAIPENLESGRYAYYTSRDRVVRYSTFAPWAPPGQNGSPVTRP